MQDNLFLTALEETKLILQILVLVVALLALVRSERTSEQAQRDQAQLLQYIADRNFDCALREK